MTMLSRLDENVRKKYWMKMLIFFSWRKFSVIFFEPKCQYVPLDQNVNKLPISFHFRVKYNFMLDFHYFLSLQA